MVRFLVSALCKRCRCLPPVIWICFSQIAKTFILIGHWCDGIGGDFHLNSIKPTIAHTEHASAVSPRSIHLCFLFSPPSSFLSFLSPSRSNYTDRQIQGHAELHRGTAQKNTCIEHLSHNIDSAHVQCCVILNSLYETSWMKLSLERFTGHKDRGPRSKEAYWEPPIDFPLGPKGAVYIVHTFQKEKNK